MSTSAIPSDRIAGFSTFYAKSRCRRSLPPTMPPPSFRAGWPSRLGCPTILRLRPGLHAERTWPEPRWQAAGCAFPAFAPSTCATGCMPQIAGVAYPCVVKPLALAASRGVIRADSPEELLAACRRIERIVEGSGEEEERRTLLVEDFVPGTEVAMEGMYCERGAFTGSLYSTSPIPSMAPSSRRRTTSRRHDSHRQISTGYSQEWPKPVAPTVSGKGPCTRSCGSMARTCGSSRSRREPSEATVRASSTSAPVVRSKNSFSLMPSAGPWTSSRVSRAAGVLMIPTLRAGTLRRVEGVLEASRVPGVEDVVIAVREGYELIPLPEGGRYLGFVFARADTAEKVEAALRQAHACLRVIVAPAWRLERGAGACLTRDGPHFSTHASWRGRRDAAANGALCIATSSRRPREIPWGDRRSRPRRRRSRACASR